jgi:hypothetical protein
MVNSPTDEFDWDAFMRDTFEASAAATGAWLRCLYKMRLSVTRGRLSWPISTYMRLFGMSVDQTKAVIAEIETLRIGDAVTESNGNITLTNRRMFRTWEAQEANRIRQLRFRKNHGEAEMPENNASVTEMSQTGHVSKSLDLKEESSKERIKTKKDVEEVFGYWQSFLNHPKAKLTSERQRAIMGRLKEGYSVEDIKRAINGCKTSSWHMGINDRGQAYNDIELICRNGTKLEKFIALLTSHPVTNGSGRASDVGKYDPSKPYIPDPPCAVCGQDVCFDLHREAA